jgi:uncharacterized protein YjbI with pentapeptide repeats
MQERKRKLATWFIAISLLTILILLIGGYSQNAFFAWTGFGKYKKPDGGYERQKTLWDWMNLLIVPAVLAGGALWFNQRREKLEHAIEDSRIQEERLQRYLDRMTELLLDHDLPSSQPDDVVRHVARARTFSVLETLSGDRRGVALRFLCESKLISAKDPRQKPVILLKHADLRCANLAYYDLSGADLAWADLRESQLQEAILDDSSLTHADLNGADLGRAYLRRANLRGAHLQQANMEGAKLAHANLYQAQLRGANLLGAKLPYANLQGAEFPEAKLESADLKHAYYSVATQWPTTFNPTSERLLYKISPESDLPHADLQQADLGGADLSGANLKGAKLQEAFLGGADLQNANLEGADLEGALYTDNSSPRMIPPVGPTIFPHGFDPQAAGMVLVTTLENLPKWHREALSK